MERDGARDAAHGKLGAGASPAGKPVSVKCPLKSLWQTAIQKGAPSGAVATISYDGNWGYRFTIADTDVRLRFTDDCRLSTRR